MRPDELLQAIRPCSLAVISLVVALLSVLALFDWTWIVLPISGILLGVCAWRSVKRRSDELTGLPLAQAAARFRCYLSWLASSLLTYEFLHEVPDNADPISYETLQPDRTVPGETIPPAALALDGKRIKGYVYPARSPTESRPSCWFAIRETAVLAAILRSPIASRSR